MSRYKKRFVFFELCQLHGKLNVPKCVYVEEFHTGKSAAGFESEERRAKYKALQPCPKCGSKNRSFALAK